jgi:hypothetical protein
MSLATGEKTISYQGNLRKLGAWLDAVDATRINILELADGFAARYQRPDVDVVIMQRFFTRAEVLALRWGDLKLRRHFRRERGLAQEPGGYQDLFRALGFDLDEKAAALIQLDERDSILQVSYLAPATGDGAAPVQVRDVYGPDERDLLRTHAHERRRHRSRWRTMLPNG